MQESWPHCNTLQHTETWNNGLPCAAYMQESWRLAHLTSSILDTPRVLCRRPAPALSRPSLSLVSLALSPWHHHVSVCEQKRHVAIQLEAVGMWHE